MRHLRPSNVDAASGVLQEVQRIVSRIRERWPNPHLILRADSGFARDAAHGEVRAERRRLRVRPVPQRFGSKR